MLPTNPLQTQRLLLHPVQPSDSDELAALVDQSADHLTRWVPMPRTRPEVGAWVDRMRAAAECGRRISYAIRTHDGTLVGCVQVDSDGELGYWLGLRHAGRGFAAEAVAAVCRAAAATLGLAHLTIRAHSDNRKSVALAERLGFEPARQASHPDGTVPWRLSAACARQLAPAWLELKRSLAMRCEITELDADAFIAKVGFSDDGKGLAQPVTARRATAFGEDWVTLTADVRAAAEGSATAMLDHNADLAVGSLCLKDGGYKLRYAGPLGPDREALLRAVFLVAHESLRLRKVQRPTDADPIFSMFCD